MDERRSLVREYLKGELSMSELCRQSGVSRKTGYKWVGRYELEGRPGLKDRSHAPHACQHRLSAATGESILAVRRAHPKWGPLKIRAWLMDRRPRTHWPAASTIGELLSREGLAIGRRKRRRAPASAPLSHAVRPNDVWTVDFKGWFRTGDGVRCDPLTMQDAASRYLLRCQALDRMDVEAVWPIFDAAFREFGLPEFMRSDNGWPFASVGAGGLSPLSILAVKAGVRPERIEPGKPQNGRIERMHRTLNEETASPPCAERRAQQRAFDKFRRIYNEERPHEALAQKPPARFYCASPRRYSGRLREPDYPGSADVRRVRSRGEIKWRSDLIYISETLRGEPVAIEEIDDGRFSVRYGPVALGEIDRSGRFQQHKRSRRRRGAGRAAARPQGSAPRPSPPQALSVL